MTRKLLQYPIITKITTYTYHIAIFTRKRIESNENDVYTCTLY